MLLPVNRFWSQFIILVLMTAGVAAAAEPRGRRGGGEESAEFYRADEVQTIDLRVAESDLIRLRQALPKRISVTATFRWKDHFIENVAVRFKGNSSSNPTQQHKRSYLIQFNEYDKNQRFLGLRRVSLDNGVQFGSVFSEPLITEILREQNVTSHRCNYAKLNLNGKYQGVYVNVERIDESFLENHLPDANGLLFKVDEGGPGANLEYLGEEPSDYARAFEPKSKSAQRNPRPLINFLRMINQSKADEFASNLESQLELDEFLRVTAVMLLSGAFDQLTGWQPHNYYLYQEGTTERWRYLPWDLDVGFSELAFGRIHVLTDWNAAWPAPGQLPHPLLDRIVNDPALLRRYRDIAKIVLEKSFEPERLCAKLDAKYALLKPDLEADPFPHRRVTNPEDRSYDDIVASMKTFIRKRYASARQQLENPGPRPPQVHPPAGPGFPPPKFVQSIQRIEKAAKQMQQNGEDLRPLMKMMQQIGPLVEKGQFDDAEKLVGDALKLIGEESEEGTVKRSKE